MALTYMNMVQVGNDALVQINPRYVVYCRQKDDGIEIGLSTGGVLHVKGDWTKVTMHLRDALAVDDRKPVQNADDGTSVGNP